VSARKSGDIAGRADFMFVDFFFTAGLPKEVFARAGAVFCAGTLYLLDAFGVESIIAPEN